jgi:hypothetical protein
VAATFQNFRRGYVLAVTFWALQHRPLASAAAFIARRIFDDDTVPYSAEFDKD